MNQVPLDPRLRFLSQGVQKPGEKRTSPSSPTEEQGDPKRRKPNPKEEKVEPRSPGNEELSLEGKGAGAEHQKPGIFFLCAPTFFLDNGTTRWGVEKELVMAASSVWESSVNMDRSMTVLKVGGERHVVEECLKIIHHRTYPPHHEIKYQPSDPRIYLDLIPFAHKYNLKVVLALCESEILQHPEQVKWSPRTLLYFDRYAMTRLVKGCIRVLAEPTRILSEEEKKVLLTARPELLLELYAARGRRPT